MATDLASRGLDIKGIETFIDYDMLGQLTQYLHRVGRTARAGKKGRGVVNQNLNECLQFSLTENIRDSSQRGRPKNVEGSYQTFIRC